MISIPTTDKINSNEVLFIVGDRISTQFEKYYTIIIDSRGAGYVLGHQWRAFIFRGRKLS